MFAPFVTQKKHMFIRRFNDAEKKHITIFLEKQFSENIKYSILFQYEVIGITGKGE